MMLCALGVPSMLGVSSFEQMNLLVYCIHTIPVIGSIMPAASPIKIT